MGPQKGDKWSLLGNTKVCDGQMEDERRRGLTRTSKQKVAERNEVLHVHANPSLEPSWRWS